MDDQWQEGAPHPGKSTLVSPHPGICQWGSWMEPDLQSVVDNGDMSPEAVTVRTVTTLRDHILSLPGARTRSIRACSEECIARDNGYPGTGRVTLGREGETSRSCCPPWLSKISSLVPMLRAIEDLDL